MTYAYINYPNPHITVHGQRTCSDIGKMAKAGQRRVRIDDSSISHELSQFAVKSYRVGADASMNDKWLEVHIPADIVDKVMPTWRRTSAVP
jgi:hypothetical protein